MYVIEVLVYIPTRVDMHKDDVGENVWGLLLRGPICGGAGELGRGEVRDGGGPRRVSRDLYLHCAASFPPRDPLHKYAALIVDKKFLWRSPRSWGSPKYGDVADIVYSWTLVLEVVGIVLFAVALGKETQPPKMVLLAKQVNQ